MDENKKRITCVVLSIVISILLLGYLVLLLLGNDSNLLIGRLILAIIANILCISKMGLEISSGETIKGSISMIVFCNIDILSTILMLLK